MQGTINGCTLASSGSPITSPGGVTRMDGETLQVREVRLMMALLEALVPLSTGILPGTDIPFPAPAELASKAVYLP